MPRVAPANPKSAAKFRKITVGLSLKQIAKKYRVSRYTATRWRAGTRTPKWMML